MVTQENDNLLDHPATHFEERGTIVLVGWIDSKIGEPGWQHHDYDLSPCRAVTLGFVLHHDHEKIVLAQTVVAEDGDTLGQVAIPTVAITKIDYPVVRQEEQDAVPE